MSFRPLHLAIGLCILAGCKRTPSTDTTKPEAEARGASNASERETEANIRAALASERCAITRQQSGVLFVRCGAAVEDRALELATFHGLVRELPSPEERRAQANAYVRRYTMDTTVPDAPPLERLRLAIRKQSYIAARAASSGVPFTVRSLAFSSQLVVLVALDSSDNIVFLDEPTLAKWKLGEASAIAKALENLDARPIPPKRFGSGDPTIYGLESVDDDYEAARLLSPTARQSLEKAVGGHAFFAIPDNQHLLAARADDARAVAALRSLAAGFSNGPQGLSADVFEADAAGKVRTVP